MEPDSRRSMAEQPHTAELAPTARRSFPKQGEPTIHRINWIGLKSLYLLILIPHVILAIVVTPFIVRAVWLAKQGRLGNWLTKQSINHVEELRGKRSAMDTVFHMHHFAHAQNDLVTGDSIGGVSGKSAASANKSEAK